MSLQEDLDAVAAKVADYLHNVCGVQDFTINFDGSIDVMPRLGKGDVIMFQSQEKGLAVRFNHIKGDFICCYSELDNMKNFPKFVGGNLDISFSKIRSLEEMPEYIDRHFICTGCGFNETDIRSAATINGKVYCE